MAGGDKYNKKGQQSRTTGNENRLGNSLYYQADMQAKKNKQFDRLNMLLNDNWSRTLVICQRTLQQDNIDHDGGLGKSKHARQDKAIDKEIRPKQQTRTFD